MPTSPTHEARLNPQQLREQLARFEVQPLPTEGRRRAAVLGRLDDYATRSGYVITPVLMWGGEARVLQPNEAEVASVHRIATQEFLRADAPLLNTVPGAEHPVLRMPVGDSWIAAPTAAFLYQFREWLLCGRATRVAHFDQPRFAWR